MRIFPNQIRDDCGKTGVCRLRPRRFFVIAINVKRRIRTIICRVWLHYTQINQIKQIWKIKSSTEGKNNLVPPSSSSSSSSSSSFKHIS